MKRVSVDYNDGIYTMYDPSERLFNGNESESKEWMERFTIEISDGEWTAYLYHQETCRIWQTYIREIDQIIYDNSKLSTKDAKTRLRENIEKIDIAAFRKK